MRKKNTFLIGLCFTVCYGFSQDRSLDKMIEEEVLSAPYNQSNWVVEPEIQKSKPIQNKALNDTLWYEDFNGSSGKFTPVNNNNNGNIWEWNTVYRSGLASTGIPRIQSTTGANGFMSLPADFYNTPRANPLAQMNTFFVSDKIVLNAPLESVSIRYQQYLAYCCSSGNTLNLEVSLDSTNWDEYDARDELPVNVANVGANVAVASNEINISCTVGGATEFWIRFVADGIQGYWWMIDDIAVVESATNDLVLNSYSVDFYVDSFIIRPPYFEIPYDLFPPLSFTGRISNAGDTSTNVGLRVSVDHAQNATGGAGQGNVYLNSVSIPSFLGPSCDSVLSLTVESPRFVPTVMGQFSVNSIVFSDSVDQNPNDNVGTVTTFRVSDTTLRRDDGGFSNGVGPADYVSNNGTPGGTTVGDRFGTLMNVVSNTANTMIPTSISFFVSNNADNIGVEITPKIWQFSEDSLLVNGLGRSGINSAIFREVASSFIPYTVVSADTNSLLTLSLTSGPAVTSGLSAGQYLVGWEVTNLPAGKSFEVYNDASSAPFQPALSNYTFLAHDPAPPTGGWGSVGSVTPAIRLNIGGLPLPTGIDNGARNATKFSVSPNPNDGLFSLNLVPKRPASYNLNVRNMLGQIVYSRILNVNGNMVEHIDLTEMEKGIYFVSLENESEKLVEKVVIK
jgi:hypothetical protein